MKLRAGSLKRKTRLTYLQLDSLRKKRAQINKVRNKRQKIMVDATEIQRITREYYEELHTKKLDKPSLSIEATPSSLANNQSAVPGPASRVTLERK